MPTERAAAYLRLSEMTETTTSPDRQRQACEDFIQSRGWEFEPSSDAFEDWDRSAFSGRTRPDFERMLEQVRAGRYAHLVVYRLDRLSRSFVHWGRVFEACDASGTVIHSVVENIDSGNASQVFGMLAGLSWSESRTIGARVKSARAKLFSEGRWPGGNRPFGWRPVRHPSGKGRTLALHKKESAHLRDAVDRVIDGQSIRSVVAGWNAEGVRTASGGTWHPSRLVALLRNPLLKGYRTENGDIVVDQDGMPVIYYPPLIDAAKFEQLQAALKDRSGPAPGGVKSLLSGVLKCGVCGGPMSGRGGTTSQLAAYHCSARAVRGAGACAGVAISQARLDATVTEWVVVRVDGLREFLDEAPDEDATPELAEIAEATAQLERWQEMYADGHVSRARYNEMTSPLLARVQDARSALAARPPSPQAQLRAALDGQSSEEVLAHFAELPRRLQRQVVAGIFSAIWIGPPKTDRGMKGIPRAERWSISLRDRVTVELTKWPGRELSAEDWLGELVMPFGIEEGDEGFDEFLHALETDDRFDRRLGLD